MESQCAGEDARDYVEILSECLIKSLLLEPNAIRFQPHRLKPLNLLGSTGTAEAVA